MANCKIPTRAVTRALSQMPVLLVVSQTNPPKFERHMGVPLFDKEAEAEVLDMVAVDALVADAEVLDLEIAEAELLDICSGNCIEHSTNPRQGGCSTP